MFHCWFSVDLLRNVQNEKENWTTKTNKQHILYGQLGVDSLVSGNLKGEGGI